MRVSVYLKWDIEMMTSRFRAVVSPETQDSKMCRKMVPARCCVGFLQEALSNCGMQRSGHSSVSILWERKWELMSSGSFQTKVFFIVNLIISPLLLFCDVIITYSFYGLVECWTLWIEHLDYNSITKSKAGKHSMFRWNKESKITFYHVINWYGTLWISNSLTVP